MGERNNLRQEDRGPEARGTSWHLDRKMSISFIVALIIYAGTAIWWASDASSRLKSAEDFIKENKGLASQLAVQNERLEFIKQAVERIEQRMENRERDRR